MKIVKKIWKILEQKMKWKKMKKLKFLKKK